MKLYHHKTDGGAEYLTDKFIKNPNGTKEGVFEGANFIVRIDGDITKDAELTVSEALVHFATDMLAALHKADQRIEQLCRMVCNLANNPKKVRAEDFSEEVRAAIRKAQGE